MPKATKSSRTPSVRPIDKKVAQSYKSLRARFSLVTKARANIWVTTAVVLFVVGIIFGIAYVADSSSFTRGFLSFSSTQAKELDATRLNYLNSLSPNQLSAEILTLDKV